MPSARRLRGVVAATLIAAAAAGARDAFQKQLQEKSTDRPPARSQVWDKSFRCVPAAANATAHAYAVVLGPISTDRKYHKWLYPILALKTALKDRGSRADLLVLLALEEGREAERMLPEEEALLRARGVRLRYVPKPRIRGFHMGHYKLWAWQHTEYARIQLLDADVLPLVDMDALFRLPGLEDAPFVGCPGKDSVLNAGWFSLKPDCEAFKRMTDLLWYRGQRKGHPWDMARGWGMALGPWLNARGRRMPAGWDFFDSRGNQGHMYAYFRFFARDLVLVYGDRVLRWGRRGAAPDARTAKVLGRDGDAPAAVAKRGDGSPLAAALWEAFPCPFYEPPAPDLAYYHFTGNKKPWSKFDDSKARYRDWYAALEAAGVDVQRALFSGAR